MEPPVYRAPSTGIFLNANIETTPLALRANVEHNHTVHACVVIMSIETLRVPHVPLDERVTVDDLGYRDDGITHMTARIGFMDKIDVPATLRMAAEEVEGELDLERASYFLSRITIVRDRRPGNGALAQAALRRHRPQRRQPRHPVRPPRRPDRRAERPHRAVTDAPRVLILSASIGEGHDLPARMIADGLRQERPGIHVRIEDGLLAMGWPIDRAVLGGARMESRAGELFFDALYWVYAQVGPTRRLGGWLLETLGGRRLLALIAAERPDIVVATYPGVSEALGRLRQHGRLDVPVASAITDLAGLYYWAHPGVDLHLVIHRESIEEVRAIAPASRIVWANGMWSPDFLVPRDRADARRALDLPARRPGDRRLGRRLGDGRPRGRGRGGAARRRSHAWCACAGATRTCARAWPRASPARAACARWASPTAMGDWLAAADALIHSTVGLTVLEAIIRGCPVISYGWGRGHIRANNRAYRRFGLAEVATTRAQLRRRAAARARPPPRARPLAHADPERGARRSWRTARR